MRYIVEKHLIRETGKKEFYIFDAFEEVVTFYKKELEFYGQKYVGVEKIGYDEKVIAFVSEKDDNCLINYRTHKSEN